jgi:hypothetical protein
MPTDASHPRAANTAAPPTPGSTCLDPKVEASLHVCPNVPASDYAEVLRMQREAANAPIPQARTTKVSPRTNLAERPFTPREQKLVEVMQAFDCTHPSNEQSRDVHYSIGRTYFEAHHWAEAAFTFHEIASAPYSELAPYAAQLSLEALNVLATPPCFELLGAWNEEYHTAMCGRRMHPGDEEMCRELERIRTEGRSRTTE